MTEDAGHKYIPLSLPVGASTTERRAFKRLCKRLGDFNVDAAGSRVNRSAIADEAGVGDLYEQPILGAAANVVMDLVDQGWAIKFDRIGPLLSTPPVDENRRTEKARVQRQEHLRRDEQLRKPSVGRFIASMERVHQHGPELVSIFNLMRDGRELADALAESDDPASVIKPYVQFVDGRACELTGFRLQDIWRYFRHTWSNAYSSVPGRSMPLLVRDAATRHHAVIGLAAISSPVVQIAERDNWMRWDTDSVLADMTAQPNEKFGTWLSGRMLSLTDEIYKDDLVRDGVIGASEKVFDTTETIARLRADAQRYREKHHRASRTRIVKGLGDAWIDRAETYLFRSRRSLALAEALEIRSHLGKFFAQGESNEAALAQALEDSKARSQIRRVVRRTRGERVGTVIADLTVCGSVAPYNALAAGKLVAALAVSPAVLTAYQKKYSRPSEIASAMAGRPIEREARLAFVGTTSLYGTGSSQYNRLFWPASVMGGSAVEKVGFHELGRSRSYGTSHFSDETVAALVRLSQLSGSLIRVNSIFGEGVSPRLRKVRTGLSVLGWPANDLLKHGRERIVYGVPLVANLRDFAMGIDAEPEYMVDPAQGDSDTDTARWWIERWALKRASQVAVQEAMRANRLVRPIRHGARVPMPLEDDLAIRPEDETPPAQLWA